LKGIACDCHVNYIRRLGLVSSTSCLVFEAHLREVKGCCTVRNNKSVEKTGLKRIARVQAFQKLMASTLSGVSAAKSQYSETPEDVVEKISAFSGRDCVIGEHAWVDLPAGEARFADIVYQHGQFVQCEKFYLSEGLGGSSCWIKGKHLVRVLEYDRSSPLLKGRVISLTRDDVIMHVNPDIGHCQTLLAIPLTEDHTEFVVPYFINIAIE